MMVMTNFAVAWKNDHGGKLVRAVSGYPEFYDFTNHNDLNLNKKQQSGGKLELHLTFGVSCFLVAWQYLKQKKVGQLANRALSDCALRRVKCSPRRVRNLAPQTSSY